MTKSKKALIAGAALAGLLTGTTATIQASNLLSGMHSLSQSDQADNTVKEKHGCKGQNSCKGKGGCKANDNGCKGKNSARARAAAQPTVRNLQRRSQLGSYQNPRSLVLRAGMRPTLNTCPNQLFAAVTELGNACQSVQWPTDYGIGIGLRSPHYHHILTRKPVVDWFEIISENFMIDGGRPLRILDQILEQYKVVQHGVSMYFGSAERPNREHLRRLKTLVQRTKTPWLSDHLCWGSVDGRYTHDLLPMPYTFEAARITAQKVREVRDFWKFRWPLKT